MDYHWSLGQILARAPEGFLAGPAVPFGYVASEADRDRPVLALAETGTYWACLWTDESGWICIQVPPSMARRSRGGPFSCQRRHVMPKSTDTPHEALTKLADYLERLRRTRSSVNVVLAFRDAYYPTAPKENDQ